MTDRLEFIEAVKAERRETFKLPGTKIGSFQREVPYDAFKPSQFTLETKRPRAKKQVETRTFDVVKIKGDSEYFKTCDHRF